MTHVNEPPSVEELDEERERLGLSRSELSRRMGREVDAWSEIVTAGIDPRLSTIQKAYQALDNAEPEAEKRGRKPCIEPDGGEA